MALRVKTNGGIIDSLKYIFSEKLVNFNSDEWMKEYFTSASMDVDQFVKHIYALWSEHMNYTINNIINAYHIPPHDVLQRFNELFKKSAKNSNKVVVHKSKDSDINEGMERKRLSSSSDFLESESSKIKQLDTETFKSIFSKIQILLCILTFKNDLFEFDDMIESLSENEKTILENHIKTWMAKPSNDTVDYLKNIYGTLKNETLKTMSRELKELFAVAKTDKRKLSELIDEYLIPHACEKKNHAEISTPYKLRQEMISEVPESFWAKPHRVFEPCSGKGGFLIDIVDKFMIGLVDEEKDPMKRYKLIVENCLYFSDINPLNIHITKTLLDPNGEYKLNYNEGNTLELDIKKKWGLKNFDLVIGNPPYNDDSGNIGRGHALWTQFVESGLEWIKTDGYLVYVHPSLWRQVGHPLLTLIKKYQLVYLEIHNQKDGAKVFKCNTRYDWYLLTKTAPKDKTTIIDEKGVVHHISLKDWPFIPNFMFEEIDTILAKGDEKKCEILKDRSNYGTDKKHVSKIKTEEFKYPVANSVTKKNTLTFRWANTDENGHFGISKIIYGTGYGTGFVSDKNGEFGLTEWCAGIVAPVEEHPIILEAIRSDVFSNIKKAIAVTTAEISTKNLRLFKENWWRLIDVSRSDSSTYVVQTTCSHMTKKGTSCKRQAKVDGKCTQHSRM